jgi:transcriptional regulator with XRE-family HTH domain
MPFLRFLLSCVTQIAEDKMRGRDAKPHPPSALSRALKVYREAHKFSQEELGAILDEDPRQIRRWENNETAFLPDVRQLKKIADRLGIPYEHLGIAPSIYVPLSLEQINSTIDRIWSLIDEGRINEAHAIAENLVREAINQIESRKQDIVFFRTFARLYHAAAHATSLSVRTDEVGLAIYYYQQMEYFARQAENDTLINIALSYQGDMYRRKSDIQRAIALLEAAHDTTPGTDRAAQGNMLQLLARSYLRANRIDEFETALKQSEEIAHTMSQEQGLRSTGNQYHLSHVYEEYAKGYDTLGKTQKALDYIDLAEKSQTITKSVEILLKVARAEALIHSGDLRNGEPLAIEAALYTKKHGHYRRLERIYALKRYVNQQMLKYGKTELALSEALEGKIEDR